MLRQFPSSLAKRRKKLRRSTGAVARFAMRMASCRTTSMYVSAASLVDGLIEIVRRRVIPLGVHRWAIAAWECSCS